MPDAHTHGFVKVFRTGHLNSIVKEGILDHCGVTPVALKKVLQNEITILAALFVTFWGFHSQSFASLVKLLLLVLIHKALNDRLGHFQVLDKGFW